MYPSRCIQRHFPKKRDTNFPNILDMATVRFSNLTSDLDGPGLRRFLVLDEADKLLDTNFRWRRAQDGAAPQKVSVKHIWGERKTGWPSEILNGILKGMLIDDWLVAWWYGVTYYPIHCMGIPFFSIKRCDRGFWTLLTWKNSGRRAYCICLVPIMAIVILTGRLVRFFCRVW